MTGRLFGQHNDVQPGKRRQIVSKCLSDQPFYSVPFYCPFRDFFGSNHTQTSFGAFVVTGTAPGKNQKKSVPGTGWIGHDGTVCLSVR